MRIVAADCVSLCIDVQERLFAHIHDHEHLLQRMTVLAKGLKLFEVPIVLTEQYPKGLGPTVDTLRESLSTSPLFVKSCFSCADDEAIYHQLCLSKASTVILFGVEAHVCVLQTVIDLRERGFRVVLVVDCVGSRSAFDRDVALQRMREEGAILTSCESILFELCRVSGTETFKKLSALVK